jgi:hypothetical protein
MEGSLFAFLCATVFCRVAFCAAGFLAAGFLAAGFLAAGFLGTGFLAAGFFRELFLFFCTSSCAGGGSKSGTKGGSSVLTFMVSTTV